jgi:hypothetical protein
VLLLLAAINKRPRHDSRLSEHSFGVGGREREREMVREIGIERECNTR